MYKCKVCGSTNVQHVMWVDLNTDEPQEAFGSWNEEDTSHCGDCGSAGCIKVVDECEACDGLGVLFNPTVPAPEGGAPTMTLPPSVERCDACKVFKTDDAALTAVRKAWGINREEVFADIAFAIADKERPEEDEDEHCECAEHNLVEGVRWPECLDTDQSRAWVVCCGQCADEDSYDPEAAIKLLLFIKDHELLNAGEGLSIDFATPDGHEGCHHPFIKGISFQEADDFVDTILIARKANKEDLS